MLWQGSQLEKDYSPVVRSSSIHNLIEEKMCVSWVLLLSLLDTHTNTHIQIMSQLHVCSCYYITSGDISSTVFNLNNGERERKRARAWKREKEIDESERGRERSKRLRSFHLFSLCVPFRTTHSLIISLPDCRQQVDLFFSEIEHKNWQRLKI